MPRASIASGQTASDSLNTLCVLDEPTEAVVHLLVAHRSERHQLVSHDVCDPYQSTIG